MVPARLSIPPVAAIKSLLAMFAIAGSAQGISLGAHQHALNAEASSATDRTGRRELIGPQLSRLDRVGCDYFDAVIALCPD